MDSGKIISENTWLGSNRRLAKTIGRPVRKFLGIEASSGILLVIAALVALIWANSPWSNSYHDLWDTEIMISFGDSISLEHHGHPLTLGQFVNDVLMVLFFFVVGLEIKREMVTGHLKKFRDALLPMIAAVGGMVVPAVIFFVFNSSGEASDGWGIPMATDIAFAIGVVSLLGPRVPSAMKIFLLTLAIVDDIGGILVIAFFYTEDLASGWLFVSALTVFGVIVLKKLNVRYTPVYIAFGFLLWYSLFESGVHATIAGVIMGLLAPATALINDTNTVSEAVQPAMQAQTDFSGLRKATFHLNESVPITERFENLLHPLTGFLIVPIFALANAGVEISSDSLSDAVSSGVTRGVVAGLVIGKIVGVSLFTFVAVRLRVSPLPNGSNFRHILGISAIAGIGFTVSMFITALAYDNVILQDEAKVGILLASALAALIGLFLLRSVKVVAQEASFLEENKEVAQFN
ncbi:MAG: Na+/H+ antiporter NhaA [Acidimicrobiaceae bacterium]|nr:Na+/H+ antiporter NhaA [Acidimicrobiaceae bacterium]